MGWLVLVFQGTWHPSHTVYPGAQCFGSGALSCNDNPRFPQKPQFAVTAPLLHSVQCAGGRALPPVKWLFDLYFARVVKAVGSREPAKLRRSCASAALLRLDPKSWKAAIPNVAAGPGPWTRTPSPSPTASGPVGAS